MTHYWIWITWKVSHLHPWGTFDWYITNPPDLRFQQTMWNVEMINLQYFIMVCQIFHPPKLLPVISISIPLERMFHFFSLSPADVLIPPLWNTTLGFITSLFVVPARMIFFFALLLNAGTRVSCAPESPEEMEVHLHAAPVPCYWRLELWSTEFTPENVFKKS